MNFNTQTDKEHIAKDTSYEKKKFGVFSSGVYIYFIIITGIINILLPILEGRSSIEVLIETGDFAYFIGNAFAASCLWFIPYFVVVIIASIIMSIIKLKLVFIESKWFLILPILLQLVLILGSL
tara:strand:+ start:166 stop:537 length:372 start_codon:yes stop_codon:yes gene_type:complete